MGDIELPYYLESLCALFFCLLRKLQFLIIEEIIFQMSIDCEKRCIFAMSVGRNPLTQESILSEAYYVVASKKRLE